jgi:hypothetical protein
MTMDRAPEPASAGAVADEGDWLETFVTPPAASAPAPDVRETYGTVDAVEGSLVVVRVSGRQVRVRRAVSCLVEPGAGDRVLVALSDESFVLAVLARGERASGVTLAVDGDVTLRSRGGNLALCANEAVTLTSGSKLELTAPELEVRAMKTSFFSASLSYVGRALDGEIDRVRLVARTVDRTIDRVTERIQQSFRTVEQIERLKAKELDIDVEGNVNVHSDNTIMSAEKLVKVDGAQIHLG